MNSQTKAKPVLVTDCDNVLVNWFANLHAYLPSAGIDDTHLKDILEGNPFIEPRVLFDTVCHDEAAYHLARYNESAFIASLPIFEDGANVILQRIAKDFDIIVVTNLSEKPIAKARRIKNLRNLYGNVFSDVVCLAPFSDKSDALRAIAEQREIALFVDDNLTHVKEALSVGMNAYQYTHNMVCGRNTGEVPEVANWRRIEMHLRDFLRQNSSLKTCHDA